MTSGPGAAMTNCHVRWGLVALSCAACRGGGEGEAETSGAVTTSASATGSGTTTATTTSTTTGEGGADDSSGSDTGAPAGPWEPGTVYPSDPGPHPRGWLDRRGLVHAHSPYSHDACDEMPRDAEGNIDAVCFEDLRRGMCQTRHDFLMLTDHRDSFSDSTFPDVLLYRDDLGDALVERDGGPVASWAACDGAAPVLVMAGCEAGTMPVGLPGHVPGDHSQIYGDATPEAITALKDHGAVVLVAHTEEWTVEQLEMLPLDGFEMYNLHANMFANLAGVATFLELLDNEDPGLPHSDLALFAVWTEDPDYLTRWGSVLAHGTRRVTTMGTDSHRNTLPQLMPDGERVDSFRRLMQGFSNHLLVQPDDAGEWDDLAIKDALRSGRLYGVFEYMGYAQGFDAYVDAGGDAIEIGGEVSLADAPEIRATAPRVQELDPDGPAPEITLHVLRAIEGGFEEVASGTDELAYVPDAEGAYRVEVRMVPRHLGPWLGAYEDDAETARVWIYANPFYVGP
jgi:hypothetical protein